MAVDTSDSDSGLVWWLVFVDGIGCLGSSSCTCSFW